MKRKFLAIAIAAIGSLGIFACAQSSSAQPDPQGTEAGADRMYRPQKFTDFAFEGIILTMDQQSKIDALNSQLKSRCDSACTARPDSVCPNDKGGCCKKDCRKGGKKGGKKGGPRGGMNPDTRAWYIGQVKEILEPEQYVTFLENIVMMPQQGPGPDMKRAPMGKDKGPKVSQQKPEKKQADKKKGDKKKGDKKKSDKK